MTRAFINVAFNADHRKGGDFNEPCDAAGHWYWLYECVKDLDGCGRWSGAHPVVVSMTAFPGHLMVPAGRERDAMWQCMRHARFVSVPHQPGHQEGAATCIRLGLEYGGKTGFDFMVHTAEDIVLPLGVVTGVLAALEGGADYVGAAWGPDKNELSSQFFACRVQALVGTFDPGQVLRHGWLERYLAHQLAGKAVCRVDYPYRHTHDYQEWRRFLKEARDG